jgi:hypothetical protein
MTIREANANLGNEILFNFTSDRVRLTWGRLFHIAEENRGHRILRECSHFSEVESHRGGLKFSNTVAETSVTFERLKFFYIHSSYSVLLTVSKFICYSLVLYTTGGTLWRSDRSVAGLVPKYTATKQKHAHTHTHTRTKHPCLKWDSNPRWQRASERRRFMP